MSRPRCTSSTSSAVPTATSPPQRRGRTTTRRRAPQVTGRDLRLGGSTTPWERSSRTCLRRRLLQEMETRLFSSRLLANQSLDSSTRARRKTARVRVQARRAQSPVKKPIPQPSPSTRAIVSCGTVSNFKKMFRLYNVSTLLS